MIAQDLKHLLHKKTNFRRYLRIALYGKLVIISICCNAMLWGKGTRFPSLLLGTIFVFMPVVTLCNDRLFYLYKMLRLSLMHIPRRHFLHRGGED